MFFKIFLKMKSSGTNDTVWSFFHELNNSDLDLVSNKRIKSFCKNYSFPYRYILLKTVSKTLKNL